MSRKLALLVLFVFLYDLSPVDLIPDFIPFIGNFDDALISALAIWFAGRRAERNAGSLSLAP